MDSSFTEHVLERARERQRKLQESSNSGQCTPLREANLILERAQKVTGSLPQQNAAEFKKCYSKDTAVEPTSSAKATSFDSTLKENCSEGRVQAILRQNSATKVSSDIPGSPHPQLKTLSIEKNNFNMEIKLISTENVRVEVELQESDGSDNEGDNTNQGQSNYTTDTAGLREQAKNQLKKLGRLYAGGENADISSPIQRTEATFLMENSTPPDHLIANVPANRNNIKPRKGLSKLADLAQNISQWEDSVSYTSKDVSNMKKDEIKGTPKRTWKPPAPQPPTSNFSASPSGNNVRSKPTAPQPPAVSSDSARKPSVVSTAQKVTPCDTLKQSPNSAMENVSLKQMQWDQSVLNSLESQGFTRTASNSRLVYHYNTSQESKKSKSEKFSCPSELTTNTDKSNLAKSNLSVRHLEITKISEESELEQRTKDITTKKFVPLNCRLEEQKVTPRSPTKTGVRSANIANKAAVFESSPTKVSRDSKDPAVLSIAEKKALFEKNKGTALIPKSAFGMATPMKVNVSPKKIANSNNKHPVFTEKNIPTNATKSSNVNSMTTEKNISKSNTVNAITDVTKVTPTTSIKTTVGKSYTPKPSVQDSPSTDSSIKAAFVESGGIASKIAALIQNKNTISQEQIENNIREQRQKEMKVLMTRFNKHKDIRSDVNECSEESDEEDTAETTAMIIERPAKIITTAEIIPPPPLLPHSSSGEKRKSSEKRTKKSDSPQVAAVLEDVKRIRVTEPKDGRLYPCLSDIETATETEPEHAVTPSPNNSYDGSICSSDGGANTSFGREILQAVCKNQTPQKRPILDESTASDVSDILDDMDDYLDEAMADQISDYSNGPAPPKVGKVTPPTNNLARPSDSFQYKGFSPKVNTQQSPSNMKSPMKIVTPPRNSTDLPTHVVDGEEVLPLTHTVSFYRRQQTQVKTPVRQINRQPVIKEVSDKVPNDSSELVSQKVQELLDEVNKQQMVISQTSQALNLCNSTPEFMGSTEQVEAEKVLLLASHRRQACLHEIQRLKVEGTLRPQGQHSQNVPLEKGTLMLSNITLPLKREYVRALAAAGGKGHHVVCLIKCGGQVIATHLVSTVASSSKNLDQELHIPDTVRLENIFSDFTVTFEVYCLQAQEEILPHEVKYHINKKVSSKLTPKKARQESRMIRPLKESPGGPQVVRTSTFALMGYIVFSIQAVNKRHWSLNKAPSMSPLEGSIEMKISCELAVSVEYKGFLTMFEDVSGFGAWHRRWCLLQGDTLSYWKYPDDEKKKAPIDCINLRNSATDLVGLVSRDICARPHTILIEREREAQAQDKESLTVVRKGDKTIIRHLLSADTKEERTEWCNMFNKALTALRMWGNN